MRVIGGKYRGRRLKSPPSERTRPTSDRLRETLFNILAPRIEGSTFLDLCAGTGAVGVEALSRGAEHVTFVDQSRKMCALIEANVRTLKIDKIDFEIVTADAYEFLRRRKRTQPPFDIVFFDPPYSSEYERVLQLGGEDRYRLLADGGVFVAEHHKKKELQQEFGTLKRYRTLKQGDSVLSFYRIER